MAEQPEKTLLGHPRGLYVLFTTELWERFSFYTMRGILTLYLVEVVLKGRAFGEGETAGGFADQIYGAYLGFVYSAPFIGGMLADRLLGQRRAIYIGGFMMAFAQFMLTTHALLSADGQAGPMMQALFFAGLAFLACGNGFFKPNISTIVGTLYDVKDTRRDSAFTIFYMGINIGAWLSSAASGMADAWGWYIGYLLAGIGMLVSLLVLTLGRSWIGDHGLPPAGARLFGGSKFGIPNIVLIVLGVLVFVPVAAYLMSRPSYVQWLSVGVGVPAIAYLLFEALRAERVEGQRMIVVIVLCVFSMMFWGTFELQGSTITRFTEEAVNRWVRAPHEPGAQEISGFIDEVSKTVNATQEQRTQLATIADEHNQAAAAAREQAATPNVEQRAPTEELTDQCALLNVMDEKIAAALTSEQRPAYQGLERLQCDPGLQMPAAFVANVVNPFLIVFLSIPFSILWVWLNRRGWEPATPMKFVLSLVQLGLAFLVLWVGTSLAGADGKCSLGWLILCYLLLTTAELCLSPVGLSMVTKLSPARLVGVFMGMWFLSSALANVIAGGVVGRMQSDVGYGTVFLRIAGAAGVCAVILLIFAPILKKMMHGVK